MIYVNQIDSKLLTLALGLINRERSEEQKNFKIIKISNFL